MANEQKFYDLTELLTEKPNLYSHVFDLTDNYKVNYNSLLELIGSMRTPKVVNLRRVNSSPLGIALSEYTIAVCNAGSNNVTLYSALDLSLLATITITGCKGIAFIPFLEEFWITGHASSIYRIKDETYAAHTLPCPNSRGIAYNSSNKDIFIGSTGTIYKSNAGDPVADLYINVGGQDVWHLCCTEDDNVWYSCAVGAFGNIMEGLKPLAMSCGAIVEMDNDNLLLSEKDGPVRVYTKSTGDVTEIPTGNVTNATSITIPTTLRGIITSAGKYITARRLSSNIGRSFLQIIETGNMKQHFVEIGIGSIGDMAFSEYTKQLYLTDYYNSQLIQIDLND